MVEIVSVSDSADELASSLQPYFQSGNINFLIGSGASLPAIQVAGNIETEINALIQAAKPDEADIKSLSFIEAIEAQCNSIPIHDFLGGDVSDTFENYKAFLENVDRILFERKNDLLPRQANIFTTNYDTFIEAAAAELPSLILNDGFDRTSALDGAFTFAPELFFDRTYRSGAVYNRQAEVPSVNLIKIHGSLTWAKETKNIKYRRENSEKLSDTDKAIPEKVATALEKRALILPNSGKFSSTLLDRVYYDLLRIFANSLDKENALLITFGFSFADEHIFDITKRALRNPTAQLLIFSYSTEASINFQSSFEHHRNVKIIVPSADTKIDFAKFNAVLKNIPPLAPT